MSIIRPSKGTPKAEAAACRMEHPSCRTCRFRDEWNHLPVMGVYWCRVLRRYADGQADEAARNCGAFAPQKKV